MQISELSNKLRVSKDGLQERKIAAWEDVYEKPKVKIDHSKTEQIICGTITVLLLILYIAK